MSEAGVVTAIPPRPRRRNLARQCPFGTLDHPSRGRAGSASRRSPGPGQTDCSRRPGEGEARVSGHCRASDISRRGGDRRRARAWRLPAAQRHHRELEARFGDLLKRDSPSTLHRAPLASANPLHEMQSFPRFLAELAPPLAWRAPATWGRLHRTARARRRPEAERSGRRSRASNSCRRQRGASGRGAGHSRRRGGDRVANLARPATRP
jgi:hypothetical protein